MGRTSFAAPEALVVVSTDGYFDVFSPAGRAENDKPLYRGLVEELGSGVRGVGGRLAIRPGSDKLAAAVAAWARAHGGAAVHGDLGRGRDGHQGDI
jgi:hypothetical protein